MNPFHAQLLSRHADAGYVAINTNRSLAHEPPIRRHDPLVKKKSDRYEPFRETKINHIEIRRAETFNYRAGRKPLMFRNGNKRAKVF